MRPQDRIIARRQLDKRLDALRGSDGFSRPPRGWIRAIREALGLTAKQLGRRLGVSQPRIAQLEKAEASGSVTLESLQRAANALDCRLVYAFVPRRPLQVLVEERAGIRARAILEASAHSMALENQRSSEDSEQAQLDRLVRELVEKSGSALWEDE